MAPDTLQKRFSKYKSPSSSAPPHRRRLPQPRTTSRRRRRGDYYDRNALSPSSPRDRDQLPPRDRDRDRDRDFKRRRNPKSPHREWKHSPTLASALQAVAQGQSSQRGMQMRSPMAGLDHVLQGGIKMRSLLHVAMSNVRRIRSVFWFIACQERVVSD